MKILKTLANSLSNIYPLAFRINNSRKNKKKHNIYASKIFIKKPINSVNYQYLSDIYAKEWSDDLSFEKKQALVSMNIILKKMLDEQSKVNDYANKMLKL